MLHVATTQQEQAFMRARKVGEGDITEVDIDALDEIIAAKDPAAVCPRCGADLFFVERDPSYDVWCERPACKMRSVARGI